MNHDHQRKPDGGNGRKSRTKWVFIGFALIAAYFLITEHKAHLSGLLNYWPFLLLAACPLLHIFMHGGHGGHGDDPGKDTRGRGSSHGHDHQ
jgi:hypothetical protein